MITPSFTREDAEDEMMAYHDCVVAARHAQDAGNEAERQKLIARASRHWHRARRIEASLLPEE